MLLLAEVIQVLVDLLPFDFLGIGQLRLFGWLLFSGCGTAGLDLFGLRSILLTFLSLLLLLQVVCEVARVAFDVSLSMENQQVIRHFIKEVAVVRHRDNRSCKVIQVVL